MNASEALIDAGEGTPEARWLPWLAAARMPSVRAADLVPVAARAVVVAPHPDDEVLAVGGLMAELAAMGRALAVVAVTDGDASHPGSSQWPVPQLVQARARETDEALRRLDVHGGLIRLRLPDGGAEGLVTPLAASLGTILRAGDRVFTTWRHDGHPDHEATARACARATAHVGARLFEVPVWAWHWAQPGDARLPWARAVRLPLSADAQDRKRHAVQSYRSQLAPDTSTGAAPILRASTVARAGRPFECFFA